MIFPGNRAHRVVGCRSTHRGTYSGRSAGKGFRRPERQPASQGVFKWAAARL